MDTPLLPPPPPVTRTGSRTRSRTIRGRIARGLGAVTVLLGLVALQGYAAIRAAHRTSAAVLAASAQEYEQAQRVVAALLGEVAAGMQYANSGAGAARQRYEARAMELDSLRLATTRLAYLSPAQRARLEEVGRVQGVLEVRIDLAHAHQALGQRQAALATLEAATGDLAAIDAALGAFRAGTAERVAAAQDAARTGVRRSEHRAAALGALALLLAIACSVSTAGVVARPLGGLVAHAAALSRGDFGARTAVGHLPGEFAALGAAMNAAGASLAALNAELTRQAYHDPLTGIANRVELGRRLDQAVARRPGARGASVGLLLLDLDGFKGVNDTLGHAAGDALLAEVAQRLCHATRGSDTAARLGGDEFAVLLADVHSDGEVTVVAERVLAALQAPFTVAGTAVVVGASIGAARATLDRPAAGAPGAGGCAAWTPAAALDALLRDADAALYAAKDRGRGRLVWFTPAMHAATQARVALEGELRAALADPDCAEFRVVYQPVLELASGRVQSTEALVRWQHPRRGLLTPDAFIEVAETTGLIVPLGRWVLEVACAQTARWQRAQQQAAGGAPLGVSPLGVPPLGVAVNVASRQLADPDFVGAVRAVLAATGLAPGSLTLELTERTVVDEPALAAERLGALRSLGVRVAIDDFGTGYSAMSYLQQFPVDVLKIDKSFVDGVAQGGPRAALARSIVALGETLALECVAEGIEDAAQHDCLAAMGCRAGQGYHFARPLAAPDLERYLERGRAGADPEDPADADGLAGAVGAVADAAGCAVGA